MTRLGIAIDLNRCFGCQTCAAACKVANNNPVGLVYNTVYTKTDEDYTVFGQACSQGAISNDVAGGTYEHPILSFLPVQCMHCDNPACVSVCPTGASKKDPDTGVVYVDTDECIGCKSCITACPYEGVRTFIESEPEYFLDVVMGEADAPAHLKGTVEKCTFCRNLVGRDEVPACMQLCPGRARYWGDLDDPDSEISQAIAGREYLRLLEDAGTEPNTYYLK